MALSRFLPSRRRGGALTRGTNWDDMTALQREMNRMFNEFYSGFDISPMRLMEEPLSRFTPSIDVKENSKEIKVTAELPGIDEKDISVSLEDNFLVLSGERKEEKKEEGEEYYHREMSYGSFRRAIPLDSKIDAEKVEAEFKNGVLNVSLPKLPGSESEKGRKIEIKT